MKIWYGTTQLRVCKLFDIYGKATDWSNDGRKISFGWRFGDKSCRIQVKPYRGEEPGNYVLCRTTSSW